MSQPNSPKNAEDRHEREVTDPVTHLPLTIHDHVSVELEQIPPHPSKSQDKHSPKHHEENEAADSNKRHATMERVVDNETHRGWWNEPGDVESRRKIRDAITAAGAAAIGGPGGLMLLWFWSKLLGRSSFGWVELFFGTLSCLVTAVAVGGCVLFLGKAHPLIEERKDSKLNPNKVSHHVISNLPQFHAFIYLVFRTAQKGRTTGRFPRVCCMAQLPPLLPMAHCKPGTLHIDFRYA